MKPSGLYAFLQEYAHIFQLVLRAQVQTVQVSVDHAQCFHTCQMDFKIKTKLFFSELPDPMQVILVKLHT